MGLLASIVIPNLDSKLVDQTLAAVRAQDLDVDSLEILVVGHDAPGLVPRDGSVRFVESEQPLGAGAAAQALAGRLLPLARRNTPFISYAHLRCAAEGVGAEPLHRAVAAVAAPSARDIGVSLDDLDRFGATSGWDALAGTALVLGNFAGSGWKRPRGRVGAQPAIS